MNIDPILRNSAVAILDVVFPPKCAVCGRLGEETLCHPCSEKFLPLADPTCRRCGHPKSGTSCEICRFTPPENLASARSAAIYDGTMRHAIIRLKYEGRKQLAEPLGMYLADFIQNRPFAVDGFDLIVPIPLHRKRLFDREFNQAALLAEQIHRATGTPMNLDCVKRERITRPQVGLTAAERTANVRGAFRVLDDYAVRGKTILLIDDVATTLSTANSCAGELLDSGAHAVHLATLARDL